MTDISKAEKLARAVDNFRSGGGSFDRKLAAQISKELRAQAARIAELEAERDRQYEQNAEFIVKIAEFERALTEAVEWNWMDHWEGVDDQNSTRCIPESISGPILSLVRKETVL